MNRFDSLLSILDETSEQNVAALAKMGADDLAGRSFLAKRYGDPVTGTLHPIGNDPVAGCGCKNCRNVWVDIRFPGDPV